MDRGETEQEDRVTRRRKTSRYKLQNCNHPATDDCTNRRWYIQSGVLLAIKTNGALISATMWVNLGNITRSEKSQTQKATLLHDPIYVKCLEKAKPQDRK